MVRLKPKHLKLLPLVVDEAGVEVVGAVEDKEEVLPRTLKPPQIPESFILRRTLGGPPLDTLTYHHTTHANPIGPGENHVLSARNQINALTINYGKTTSPCCDITRYYLLQGCI